ncbi:MAG: DNA-3-methyladenine glycosylase 2 family protein [Selenomonadaceae bacterium]|nr:DNA-3-methyladenine glycosylase 2 family protein [Selenomonadaceae bacterium]
MPLVTIEDDFDLKKIADSGQCFRAKEVSPGVFRFITLDHVIDMEKIEDETFKISCGASEWELIWSKYFDIQTDYAEIRKEITDFGENKPCGEYLRKATEFGKGIRILRQDPFETLISFIISQRKSIPAIRTAIELICESFGDPVKTADGSEINAFPQVDELCKVSAFELSKFSLGYRSAYVHDALQRVKGLSIALDDLFSSNDDDLMDTLKTIRGVGDKIAACVALYAYHRFACVPVDVWIKRAIKDDFKGENVFVEFGSLAGVLQQYIFYYKRFGKKDLVVDDDE